MYEKTDAMMAPAQPEMVRDGVAALQSVPGVLVRQKLQLLDAFCTCFEKRNRYRISGMPHGLMGENPKDDTFKSLPTFMEVREQSTCCMRFWCGRFRELTLGFFPSDTPDFPQWPTTHSPVMSIHRPFKCTIYCCCCLCNPQEVSVMSSAGEHVGRVLQDFRCFPLFCKCTHWSKGYDKSGNHIYSFKAPWCSDGNCCAPTCCNTSYKISVKDGNNEDVNLSSLRNIFPGCNCRGVCCGGNVDNYVVEFPGDATPEQRALIMGALFYHDFLLFENNGEE